MEAELRAFLRELHTEQQAKLQKQYMYYRTVKFSFSEKPTKVWCNRPQGFDVS